MIIGLMLLVAGTCIGWVIGRSASLLPVRWVTWWVSHVVMPMIRSRRWWRRAALIFINNATILGILLAAGFDRILPVLLIASVGVSLGIGLRVLSCREDLFSMDPPDSGPTTGPQVTVGFALNLLELPAIVLAVGLSLGRKATPLAASLAWEAFAVWVLPLLILGAAGEALWLGSIAGHRPPGPPDASALPPPDTEDTDL
jgi:hypothetical protein